MDYRYLGRSGLKVSPICLGAMMFGQQTDETVSARIIGDAAAHGVNFIDTADSYGMGASEEIVGRVLGKARENWVVATKFANAAGPGPNQRGMSRKWIFDAVERSLKRLGMDYIDILYFHRAVTDAPLGEAVRAVADLIGQGKIRYFGVSNFKAWRLAETVRLADGEGIDRPIASQPVYNICDRTVEIEHIPAAVHYGVGLVTYSPLARGVLTGKYAVGEPPAPDTRAGRNDRRIMETEWREDSLKVAARIAEYAAARGTDAQTFSMAWVMANRFITSTLAGPRTEAQWGAYLKALEFKITAEDEAFVDSLVYPGHPSTHGYIDPNHPVEGRQLAGSV